MKAIDLLRWASTHCINFADFGILDFRGSDDEDLTRKVSTYFKGMRTYGKLRAKAYMFYCQSNYAFFVDDPDNPCIAIEPDVVIATKGDEIRLYEIEE